MKPNRKFLLLVTRVICVTSPLAAGLADQAPPVAVSPTSIGDDEVYREGVRYLLGEGVEADAAKAFDHFRESAELGNVKARHNVGNMLINGQGTDPNPEEGARWVKMAAESGAALSQYLYGTLLIAGNGVSRDESEAVDWFRLSAEQRYPPAQGAMGEIYFFGREGEAVDYDKAAFWSEQAALGGVASAQNLLGNMAENGLGQPIDLKLAADWYQKAAERGDAKAQASLAIFLMGGLGGLDRDVEQAYAWLSVSADAGEITAQKLLEDLEPSMAPEELIEGKRRVILIRNRIGFFPMAAEDTAANAPAPTPDPEPSSL